MITAEVQPCFYGGKLIHPKMNNKNSSKRLEITLLLLLFY